MGLLNNILKIFNGTITKGEDMFDLKGYKAEEPSEGGGFEPFKYTGPCKINKSIISTNETIDSEYYPKGCIMIEIEAEVLQGEFKSRKLWKRFNLDDETKDKKGKTSAMKLADQLFPLGIEFSNLEELRAKIQEFVTMIILVKAWTGKFPGEQDRKQMWNIKGKAPQVWEEDEVPESYQEKVAF